MMNIYIFVKHVPDTEARIRIDKSGKDINREDITFTDSPYDEYAVEQALLLAEADENITTTVVTIGKESAESLLRDNLAKGINEATLIHTDEYGEYDALSTSRIIAAYMKDKKYDLLLFGNKAYGSDNALVPSMVAALLDISQINLVVNMNIKSGKIEAERQIEGMSEKVEASMPCLISAQKGLNEPRMKSLKGIMAAKKKEIPRVTLDDLSLSKDELKISTTIEKLEMPPEKAGGKIFEGEPEDGAKALVDYFKNEMKIL
jgi:electron transfer flavoprotein beta subunit